MSRKSPAGLSPEYIKKVLDGERPAGPIARACALSKTRHGAILDLIENHGPISSVSLDKLQKGLAKLGMGYHVEIVLHGKAWHGITNETDALAAIHNIDWVSGKAIAREVTGGGSCPTPGCRGSLTMAETDKQQYLALDNPATPYELECRSCGRRVLP